MSVGRVKVVFKDSVDLRTMDMFATVLEIFGALYRTQAARSIVVMPSNPRSARNLEVQLAEWEKEGTVESWDSVVT